jgi:DNA segregation ATPase FtsK/SpoIIIE, S-DNA-T family
MYDRYTRESLQSGERQTSAKDAWWQRFSGELTWAVLILATLILALALLSHDAQDPAWSTSGQTPDVVNNAVGFVGAYLSDILLYVFGFSSCWFLLWLVLRCLSQFLAMRKATALAPAMAPAPVDPLAWRALALLAFVVSSSALEFRYFHHWDAILPGTSGGVLGHVLATSAQQLMAASMTTLFFLLMLLGSAGQAFGFGWLRLAEKTGAGIFLLHAKFKARRQKALDQALGEHALADRHGGAVPPDEGAVAASLQDPRLAHPPEPEGFGHMGVGEHQEPGFDTPSPIRHDAPEAALQRPIEPAGTLLQGTLDTFMETPKPQARTATAVVIEPAVTQIAVSKRVQAEKQHALFSEELSSTLPRIDLLDPMPRHQETVSTETLEMTSRLIEKKLSDFGVQVQVVAAAPGPVVTRYEIEPATGVKGSQIVNLAKDLARSLSLVSIRVIETIPGKNCMALELPNAKRQAITLGEILGSKVYNDAKSLLTMGLGKDIVGNPVVADLAKMPHVLVAGTTGSGKSVGINAMILSLLYKAEARDVRLLMIDPKMLEMSMYEGIPHLLAPVVTDMKQAAHGLNWCVAEMERRYKVMSKLGVRNLAGYNQKIDDALARDSFVYNPFALNPENPDPLERMPHIVIIIDELADLMMVVGKKIEELIARLAQKARAAGIHLILATQRPSVDVITGLIKANVPSRISFQVSSKIDSRTILDQMGAEALLGMGDMLYMASGTGLPVRVHGAFVSDNEVHRVVEYIKSKGEPDYVDGVLDGVSAEEGSAVMDLFEGGGGSAEKDPMYDQAVEVVLKDRKASISYVQRKLKIGYNRSARLLEDMEKAGIVSSLTSSGQRDILVPNRHEG